MLNISYTLSPRLREDLYKIERLRRQILLLPLSPKIKLKLRWEAIFNRTYSSLKLCGNPLRKNEMLSLFKDAMPKKIKKEEQDVLKYKKALDFVRENWLGSENPVDIEGLIELHRKIDHGSLDVQREELKYLLDYLQARAENPIIQAGIVNIEIEKMQPFSEKNKEVFFLSPLLFLYKMAYDFRGLLAYEKVWLEEEADFRENVKRARQAMSLTVWLEYFTGSILKELEAIVQSLSKPKPKVLELRESFWELNERQKSILSYLDQPHATITNRQIQKRFKTSQITASRDLSKLTNLGLLFSHGKGRSVYYTKI